MYTAGSHPLQQRPVGCFSSLLIHNFQILGSALCQLREVPSQLTGAPQSNDWREVAGAQGLCCRGRNGARSKVPWMPLPLRTARSNSESDEEPTTMYS